MADVLQSKKRKRTAEDINSEADVDKPVNKKRVSLNIMFLILIKTLSGSH